MTFMVIFAHSDYELRLHCKLLIAIEIYFDINFDHHIDCLKISVCFIVTGEG